jgi:hypothetical protein
MPRGFRFVDLSPDLFLAQRLATNRADEFSYNGMGRLKPGLSVPQATRTSLAYGGIGLITKA